MKAGLAAGRVQIGTWINMVHSPSVLTLLKSAGLDYARIDMEHSPPSIESVANLAAMSRALDFPIAVRPPDGNREWISRLLDIGVWGLHIPQVDNPDIAREVVRYARYAPVGLRGQAGFSPGTDFDRSMGVLQRQALLNEQVHITIMFESAEAFRHIEEILAVPGIDAVTLGPSDLAAELGVTGTPDQARVIDEHRDRLIEAANRHGKDVAMLVETLDEAERWIKAGVKIIAYSSDTSALYNSFNAAMKRLRPEG
jgi:2-keto-3-deoxy-L-rhamnonate aldolase RhmA